MFNKKLKKDYEMLWDKLDGVKTRLDQYIESNEPFYKQLGMVLKDINALERLNALEEKLNKLTAGTGKKREVSEKLPKDFNLDLENTEMVIGTGKGNARSATKEEKEEFVKKLGAKLLQSQKPALKVIKSAKKGK